MYFAKNTRSVELSRIWMLSSVRPRPLSLSTRPRVSNNVTSVPLAPSSENLAYYRHTISTQSLAAMSQ